MRRGWGEWFRDRRKGGKERKVKKYAAWKIKRSEGRDKDILYITKGKQNREGSEHQKRRCRGTKGRLCREEEKCKV
jgi:hypothetical protein